jgi:hypothetical protein
MKNVLTYMPTWFRVMVVASVAVITYGIGNLGETCPSNAGPQAAESNEVDIAAHEIHDSLWLDRVPEMMHDSWNGYIFTPDNVGLAIQADSAFKLTLEIFEFQLRKGNIRWHFPHDGKKADTKFTIEKLKKPTKHFDRQLTIENDPKNGGQTKVYFTGPEFANAETIESLAPGASARLSGYLPAETQE